MTVVTKTWWHWRVGVALILIDVLQAQFGSLQEPALSALGVPLVFLAILAPLTNEFITTFRHLRAESNGGDSV